MTKQTTPGASLRRARPVRRALLFMVPLMLIGAVVGYLAASSGPATWTASEDALIQVWSIDSQILGGQAPALTSADQADATTIATSQAVLDGAVKTLNQPGLTSEQLRSAVIVTSSQTSHFVTLKATGSSAEQAQARVKALADSFVVVAKAKVLASASRLADLPISALGTTATAEELRLRAIAIAQTVEPIQLYPADDPTKGGTSTTTSAAGGGIVGLAVGALIVVGLSFSPPRLRTAGEATRRLGLPSADWSVGQPTGEVTGLLNDLRIVADQGLVAICPVGPSDAGAADDLERYLLAASTKTSNSHRSLDDEFAGELAGLPVFAGHRAPKTPLPRLKPLVAGRSRSSNHVLPEFPPTTRRHPRGEEWELGVMQISSPASGLAVTRPDPEDIDTLVLITSAGTVTADVERAVAALSEWRQVDAVVVANTGR